MGFGPDHVNEVLGATLLGSPYTGPNTLYLSLATSLGSEGLAYAELPSGMNYGRQVIVFGGPPAARKVSNTNELDFNYATTPWGHLTHWAIHDAETDGTLLHWGSMPNTLTVVTSTQVLVSIGSITVRLQNCG